MMRIIMITESDEDASDYTIPKLEHRTKDKIDGCTDKNGTRREIGEKWSTYDGCNSGGLVSN